VKKFNFKIVEARYKFLAVSLVIMAVGLVFMIANAAMGNGAFNFDVDFSGGTSFTIDVGQDFDNSDIIGIVDEVTGQESPQVQRITNTTQVMVRMRQIDPDTRIALRDAFIEKYGIADDAFEYSDISASVSADMQRSAVLAIVVSCVAMLIYVAIRFRDVRMGSAAIMALIHDSFIMIAFYAILRIPLNNSFIAAILTILGYSINSTIVTFDRVRENKSIMRKPPLIELINASINQTLRRSIFTSSTVFVVVLALYIFGVSSIREFTLPIIVGVVAGAYSSSFLAGSFWYMLSERKPKLAVISSQPAPAAPADASEKPAVKQLASNTSATRTYPTRKRHNKKRGHA
jgi:preprotein translocase SecF subunit